MLPSLLLVSVSQMSGCVVVVSLLPGMEEMVQVNVLCSHYVSVESVNV